MTLEQAKNKLTKNSKGEYSNILGDKVQNLSCFSGTEYTNATKWQVDMSSGDVYRERTLKDCQTLIDNMGQ